MRAETVDSARGGLLERTAKGIGLDAAASHRRGACRATPETSGHVAMVVEAGWKGSHHSANPACVQGGPSDLLRLRAHSPGAECRSVRVALTVLIMEAST
jgi:hypothetical protein